MGRAVHPPEPRDLGSDGRDQGFLGQQVGLGDDADDDLSSSRTGNALTRYSESKAAMSLNPAFFLTATTRVVITSFTLALICADAPSLG